VSDACRQSLFLIAYPGKGTADEVYHSLRGLEKQDKIEIKTAATLYRTEEGKLRLKHRQRLTLWKDEFDVGSVDWPQPFKAATSGEGVLGRKTGS